MRQRGPRARPGNSGLMLAGLIACGLELPGLGGCAPAPPAAVPAERFAAPAAAQAAQAQGYSAGARHIADCLASYPGYDYRTDQVPAGPGVTRPCPL